MAVAHQHTATTLQDPTVETIPPRQLFLDPRNPRLADQNFDVEQQTQITAWLYRNMAVEELLDSILANGYWHNEELIAVEENDRLIVVEGNRRLAAVKLILEPALRNELKVKLPRDPSDEVLETLQSLPTITSTREDVWRFIGFKHVNGSKPWDSIAKAQYIVRVHIDLGIPLNEIASTIGDQHETVVRLYRGYVVLEQAKQQTGFSPDDAWQRSFPFSHLWTALGYTNVRDFLGTNGARLETAEPVPIEKVENLGLLMRWLFGSRRDDVRPLVLRQNPDLRTLIEALGNKRGVAILRAGLPLQTASEASRGDSALFAEAVVEAEERLREAMRFLATGYAGEPHLLDTSRDILNLAKTLDRGMRAAAEQPSSPRSDESEA